MEDKLKEAKNDIEKAKSLVKTKLEELSNQKDPRIVLCIYYNIDKSGKKNAEKAITDKKYTVLSFGDYFCYILTTKTKADSVIQGLRDNVGRCYVSKYEKVIVSENFEKVVEKLKTPTNNTKQVRVTARTKRKESNKVKFISRKKKRLTKRVRKENKKKKIEAKFVLHKTTPKSRKPIQTKLNFAA